MGKYMTVTLKNKYNNSAFIGGLNKVLFNQFGANNSIKFNPWNLLQEDADYFNDTIEGLKQLGHIKRPLTPKFLSDNFFWYNNGTYSFKLSGEITAFETRDPIAVACWIKATNSKYINKRKSSFYEIELIAKYLNPVLIEENWDLKQAWKFNI